MIYFRGRHGAGGNRFLRLLFEGFDILGIQIQYWMPLAAVIATIAIAHSVR
jgi:hypothetical protein